jgi:hypothetical protein
MIVIVGHDRVKYSTESCGREQDSGETERERERGRVLLQMASVIKLAIRENIYDRYRRIILHH